MQKINYFTSNRQIQLFKILCEEEKPLSREHLGKKLAVSTRTILTEIKDVNYIIENYGFEIINKRGLGYKINFEEEKEKDIIYRKILNECIYYDLPIDSEERARAIIRKLLEKNDFCTVQEFSEMMYVSKQTISNDLKIVRLILKKFDLSLKIKASHGLAISGDEKKKRKCYSHSLPFRKEDENIYSIGCREKEFFREIDLEKIAEIVTENIKKVELNTTDLIDKILIIHIAISIKRIRLENVIDSGFEISLNEYRLEKELTRLILEDIEEVFEVKFNQNEFNYILIYIICCVKEESLFEDKETKYSKFTKDFLENIWINYKYDFRQNKKLIKDLEIHIASLIKRAEFSMKVKNSILEEIKQKYPIYFEMALMGLKEILVNLKKSLEENLDDEVGFLALHLAAAEYCNVNELIKKEVVVVCGSGLGSGRLIEAKLKSMCENYIVVKKVMSYSEYNKSNDLKCDFVITPLELEEKDIPIIKIKSIPNNDEILNLMNLVKSDKEKKGNILKKFLKEEIYFTEPINGGKDEVIKFLCDKLKGLNYVGGEFEKSVYEREKLSSTVLGGGIAMPHPIVPSVKKTGVAILNLEKPIKWEKEEVKIIFMLNIAEEDYEDLGDFYDNIVRILNNDTNIDEIYKCKNINDFIKSFMK